MEIKTRHFGLLSIAVMQGLGQFLGTSGVCEESFINGLETVDYMSVFAGVLVLADWFKARLKNKGKLEINP